MDNNYMGKLFRNKRLKAGLSLRVVADRMGIDPSMLSRLEKGDRDWSSKMTNRFLDVITVQYAPE